MQAIIVKKLSLYFDLNAFFSWVTKLINLPSKSVKIPGITVKKQK